MIFQILISSLIVLILIYLFYIYLKWAKEYRESLIIYPEKKNSIYYKLLPSRSLEDSSGYLYFNFIYLVNYLGLV